MTSKPLTPEQLASMFKWLDSVNEGMRRLNVDEPYRIEIEERMAGFKIREFSRAEKAAGLFMYYRSLHPNDPICAGCGQIGRDGYSRLDIETIESKLKTRIGWSEDQIASEIERIQILGGIALCDDCWRLEKLWSPGQAEALHRLAWRLRDMPVEEIKIRRERLQTIHRRRFNQTELVVAGKRSYDWLIRAHRVERMLWQVVALNDQEKLK